MSDAFNLVAIINHRDLLFSVIDYLTNVELLYLIQASAVLWRKAGQVDFWRELSSYLRLGSTSSSLKYDQRATVLRRRLLVITGPLQQEILAKQLKTKRRDWNSPGLLYRSIRLNCPEMFIHCQLRRNRILLNNTILSLLAQYQRVDFYPLLRKHFSNKEAKRIEDHFSIAARLYLPVASIQFKLGLLSRYNFGLQRKALVRALQISACNIKDSDIKQQVLRSLIESVKTVNPDPGHSFKISVLKLVLKLSNLLAVMELCHYFRDQLGLENYQRLILDIVEQLNFPRLSDPIVNFFEEILVQSMLKNPFTKETTQIRFGVAYFSQISDLVKRQLLTEKLRDIIFAKARQGHHSTDLKSFLNAISLDQQLRYLDSYLEEETVNTYFLYDYLKYTTFSEAVLKLLLSKTRIASNAKKTIKDRLGKSP